MKRKQFEVKKEAIGGQRIESDWSESNNIDTINWREVNMSRTEARKVRRGKNTAAGNMEVEVEELRKLQNKKQVNGIETISISCSEILSLICC